MNDFTYIPRKDFVSYKRKSKLTYKFLSNKLIDFIAIVGFFGAFAVVGTIEHMS